MRGDEHVVIPVSSEDEAIRYLREVQPDLVIAEGTLGGTKLLSQVRELDSAASVIMLMAGPPSVEQVVTLMNQGVSDVLVSPLDINDVRAKVERALSRHPATQSVQIRFHELVGSCPQMQLVFRKMIKTVSSHNPVLILGEKGVGKRLVAEQIHALGKRKDGPFTFLHCAGLTAHELEHQLFGHAGHSANGPAEPRRGLVEASDGGTFFIEEVHCLAQSTQAKLLRFLEDQLLQRIGSDLSLTLDVRIIAASSENLEHHIQDERFRPDLFYALSTNLLELPPLRARVLDIPELVDLFLARYDVQIAGEAMELLMNYSWPGNVDELKNAVEQAVNICDNNRVELKDLPPRVLKAVAKSGRQHKFVARPKDSP
jgi:DNA-binding NtrC family response regulator